jgi:hypothetical protein
MTMLRKAIGAVLLALASTAALAQAPTTTKPNISTMGLTNCTVDQLLFGGGSVATPVCSGSGTNGQIMVGQTGAAPLFKTITGDVTFTAAGAAALGNIPNDTPVAGDVLVTNTAAPSTPAAGKTRCYTDSTSKNLNCKNDGGTVVTAVVPNTPTNQVFTALASTGVFSSSAVTSAMIQDGTVANADLANMANSTIKCRTTAGTGVPEDCTAAQAAAIVQPQLLSKAGSFTRDISLATGTQPITGVGFTPTRCSWSSGGVGFALSTGYSDSAKTGRATIILDGAGTGGQSTGVSFSIYYSNSAASNIYSGNVSTYDADGFTISWTKTGTPTGTLTISFMCER